MDPCQAGLGVLKGEVQLHVVVSHDHRKLDQRGAHVGGLQAKGFGSAHTFALLVVLHEQCQHGMGSFPKCSMIVQNVSLAIRDTIIRFRTLHAMKCEAVA